MAGLDGDAPVVGLPSRPLQKLTRPLVRFLHIQAVLLSGVAGMAILWMSRPRHHRLPVTEGQL